MARIHHEENFPAPPARVYRAIVDSAEHARFTGAPADCSPDEGGRFSAHGGWVHGRNVELRPGARIVQAWRGQDWPDGVYSIARFELRADGAGTRLVFDHDGVPDEQAAHIDEGWRKMYWTPLRAYLTSAP